MGAVLDPTGLYRYTLWREWDPAGLRVAFVMLNPSAADARRDDPTIRRCIAFAHAWGYGSLEVVNLFAYRTSRPATLQTVPDPIGPEADRYLLAAAYRAQLVVAAWGVHGSLRGRDQAALRLLAGPLHCLGTTRRGHPRHPLYLSRETVPVPYRPTEDGPSVIPSSPQPPSPNLGEGGATARRRLHSLPLSQLGRGGRGVRGFSLPFDSGTGRALDEEPLREDV